MIKSNIANAKELEKYVPSMKKAFDFLSQDFSKIQDGRHVIDDNCYVNVSTYDPKEYAVNQFEAHKNYIDIQYVIEGNETIKVADLKDCNEVKREYDKDNDYAMYGSDRFDVFNLEKGEFLVLFPEDGHMPGVKFEAKTVRKAVVKFRVL